MFQVGTTNEETRTKWIESSLKKIPPGLRILDAGAGECQYKKYCSHLVYVSQDFAQYTGEGKIGLQTGSWDNSKLDIISDITNIPVANDEFDAVMCTEVLEHVPDPVSTLKELNRILKPNGYLLLTTPFASLTHFAPFHYSSGFNSFFYYHHLTEMNYEIVDLSLNGNYYEFLAQELRRVKKVAHEYSGIKINLFEKIAIHSVLPILQRLSKRDNKSQELLCYGIHVFARKK